VSNSRLTISSGSFGRFRRRFAGKIALVTGAVRSVELPERTYCRNLSDFVAFRKSNKTWPSDADETELSLVKSNDRFTVPGHCAICRADVNFLVDHAWESSGPLGVRVNWRETLYCPKCLLNNRMRAGLGFLLARGRWLDQIYITEQTTRLYRTAIWRRPRMIGSEFLDDGTMPGSRNARGLRHEDATRLSFSDSRFDRIGSFDVLEHIPDYRRALGEFHRCLKPGGKLLITVPFALDSPTTLTRARLLPDGQVEHLLPPEIHGNPIDLEGGALCFYHFGWDFLDDLHAAGFVDAELSFFWSQRLGYLGGYPFVIQARKAAPQSDLQ
jgi:SAM-dependent methyltransferase